MSDHCKGEWFEMVCNSIKGKGLELSGVPLPGFPENEVQINTTGQSGREAMCEAFIFYEDCLKVFSNSIAFERDNKTLLDFGVGWGRVLRFFMREFLPENMYGVDINKELLRLCKETFKWGTFIESNAFPPLELSDQSIDFIAGYSVFSHLSEDACLKWIKEFSRILRPGGVVALTTRGRWFLEYCESLKNKNVNGYAKALSNLFDDFNQAKKKYDNGKFLHSNIHEVSGGGPLNSSFYGETFMSEKYAKKTYSKFFKVLDFVFKQGRSIHPIMVLIKGN
jgi:ubiquinone/menaquinone biosynthesis C-methylase UbiE